MRIVPRIFPQNNDQRAKDTESELIRMEAQIGGKLFGPIPEGHRREFFCLDASTWVWHESWLEKKQQHAVTTRYIVRPNSVLKTTDGNTYQPLSTAEARNLYQAAELYRQQVGIKYQKLVLGNA